MKTFKVEVTKVVTVTIEAEDEEAAYEAVEAMDSDGTLCFDTPIFSVNAEEVKS